MKNKIKALTLFCFCLMLCSSCASVNMKRCPDEFKSEAVWKCSDVVQGIYRSCEEPKDLYSCTDPQ